MYPQQQFLPHEEETLQTATSYTMLSAVALAQLGRMRSIRPMPPGIVCGPISTGGLGSKAENIKHFERVVRYMVNHMKGHFFNQIPFEAALWRVQALRKRQEPGVVYSGGAGNPLLEEFYRPIFESGLIGAAFFIKGWESSDGARWEHNLCEQLGISIWHFNDRLEPSLVQRHSSYQ